ncbi:MAG: hypothetical protein AAF762_07850 [Pseudomonadota bacterium]
MSKVATGNTVHRDAKDWAEAFVNLLFLAALPAVTGWLWLTDRAEVPLFICGMFTVVTLLAAPLLWRRVTSVRTRDFRLDPESGSLTVLESTPFSRRARVLPLAGSAMLEFQTANCDGYWYTALIRLNDGDDLVFAQGSQRRVVQAAYQRFHDELLDAAPGLLVTEVETRT